MPRLTPISAKKLVRILLLLGFVEIRKKGSHHFFRNYKTKNTTVIPIHGSEDIGVGLLRKILRDIDIDPSTFLELR